MARLETGEMTATYPAKLCESLLAKTACVPRLSDGFSDDTIYSNRGRRAHLRWISTANR
jgi:hypothetical protein